MARIEREDPSEIGAALAERSRAIEAIRRWIAAEIGSARPVSPEVMARLTSDLETGKQVLLRRVMAREITRADLLRVGRELQMLRHLRDSSARQPVSLNCCG
jgi:hypothetical protein